MRRLVRFDLGFARPRLIPSAVAALLLLAALPLLSGVYSAARADYPEISSAAPVPSQAFAHAPDYFSLAATQAPTPRPPAVSAYSQGDVPSRQKAIFEAFLLLVGVLAGILLIGIAAQSALDGFTDRRADAKPLFE